MFRAFLAHGMVSAEGANAGRSGLAHEAIRGDPIMGRP